ncbi:hypothetical protein [Streptomyces sp. NPDC002550]
MDAFKKVDAYFTADDEPFSISDWQADNGNLSADIAQLATDGLGVGGPDDATYRRRVRTDASKFPHDFQVAEADVDEVAAGKSLRRLGGVASSGRRWSSTLPGLR